MKPTQDDIRILFEGKSDELIKLYKQELDDFVDYEDFQELILLEEDERMPSLFELLFTIPVAKIDDDDDVVHSLAEEFLPYEVDADYDGNNLIITAAGQEHIIKMMSAPKDRYLTLRKLNDVIKPEFEIRVMTICLSDDIHSLLILKTEQWDNMDSKYGNKVGNYFKKIDAVDFL